MASVVRAVQICADYSDASGGTTASVRQFQRTLGGSIIAFQKADLPSTTEPALLAACDEGVRGRLYRWVPQRRLLGASDAIASANLIVCHMLYQYHIQWATKRAREARTPYWVIPHGSLDPYVFSYRSVRKRAWIRAVGKRIIKDADRVIFATQREMDKAEQEIGRLQNGYVIPWPVSPVFDGDKLAQRNAIRHQLGIGASRRVLLYCGRLHSSKRALETIGAVGPMGAAGISMIMIGPDGDLARADCEALCLANGWTNVHFVGPVYGERKYDYFNAADGYISLSHKENFGYTVAEGLASGLPVVLSPGIDLAEDLREVECGWILRDVSPSSVAKVLHDFATEADSNLTEKGRRGREWSRAVLSEAQFEIRLQNMAADDVATREIVR